MKKIFNNAGVTLIEVVAAVVILGVIAVPIFNTLMQTAKLNATSDLDMKMKAEAERIIELVKAEKGDLVNAGTADGKNYATGYVDYDMLFADASTSGKPAKYRLIVSKSQVNTIDTLGEYDRWDFKIKINNSTNTTASTKRVQVYKNTGYHDSTYSGYGGKLFYAQELTTESNDPLGSIGLDFTGESLLGDKYKFLYNFKTPLGDSDGPNSPQGFEPGSGAINTLQENTIIVNVDRDADAPPFNISVNNSTFKTGLAYYVVDGKLSYHKNVIINVFNDDPASPTVAVTPNSPCITVNRTKAVMPVVKNGYKITITITDIASGNSVKVVPSVVE